MARLFLAIVFVAGTTHAPATAHADPAAHATAFEALLDRHEEPVSSHDRSGGGAHHHHCPVAADLRGPVIATLVLATAVALHPFPSRQLSSVSQAPPPEPPAA